MEKTVSFRDFEERDIDFIYKCKNDDSLNSMIVGEYHHFTYEEATKWVHGCMGEHETYKFWAVCTNDVEKRIVGWVSLSEIDRMNRSASLYGIVIADPQYRDGFAWIESYLFVYEYAFNQLRLEKVFGEAFTDHILSQSIRKAFYAETIELKERAVFREGKYHDLSKGVMLNWIYKEHFEKGDYDPCKIIRRISKFVKQAKE